MVPAISADGSKLPRINRWLAITNILIAVYIFITPLLPGLMFYLRKSFTEPPAYSGKLSGNQQDSGKTPVGNRLVIPSILLDEEIHEGEGESTLSKGVWRRPNTSTPDKESNTVMAGHIFTYSTPAVFYNLHRVQIGDRLAVYWEGSEYLYEVKEKLTVPASAVEVEASTPIPVLTLYTCTPLWNPVNRMVVISDLVEVTEL